MVIIPHVMVEEPHKMAKALHILTEAPLEKTSHHLRQFWLSIRLTCQRALCNRRERQGDSPRVIVNRLTCQRALRNRRERQGDSPRVIANRLTCQRALCNRRKRQGGSQRVTVTDLVHGSSTTVQNRVQCKENSTRSNENLSISKLINTAINVKLLKSKVTLNARENVKVTHQTEGDLGNESKVNET
jgi:hypothetical protein